MTARDGILCAGCWTLDQIRIVDRWPDEEALALTLRTDQQGGGSAHNVSIDLKKLDSSARVFTAGMLGEDAAGDFLFEQASRWGVDTQQLHRSPEMSTSFTDVMSVESSGKRTFFHHAGANDLLTPDHIDFEQCPASMLHLGLLGVHRMLDQPWGNEASGWVEVLKQAKQHGLRTNIEMVSIDAETNKHLALPCFAYLDSLIINDYEAGCLSGIETLYNAIADADACMAAAEHLLACGAMEVVIVHFPGGAAAVKRSGDRLLVPSVKVDPAQVKGSVGAGDAFTAGVLYGFYIHAEFKRCVLMGHAVAAASLRSDTTVGSVEDLASCLRFAGWPLG
ncbi:MAG: carbohydrate kinase family protein [Granulosicoccaceae bacterium]